MRRKVVVTGCTGFIGRRLMVRLERGGFEAIGLSKRNWDIVNDPGPSIMGASRIVHLAALSFVPDSWNDPISFYETNLVGLARVLEMAQAHKAAMTFVSSYVYGTPHYLPIDEAHPMSALNPYAQTKVLGEQLCNFYAEQGGVPLCIIRPFNIYGPGQASHFLIPSLVQQVRDPKVQKITVADIRPRRDYVFVDDFVELLYLTCVAEATGVFNAASGISHSIPDIVSILGQLYGAKGVMSRNEPRAGEILDVRGDSTRARERLGWCASTPLAIGLSRVGDHLRES